MENTKSEESWIVDTTEENIGKAYQILIPSERKEEERRKYEGDNTNFKIVVLGFIFRTFLIVYLFWKGQIIINAGKTMNFSFVLLFSKLIGFIFVFVSLLLVFNIFSKKVTRKIYQDWGIALLVLLPIFFILIIFPFLLSTISGDPHSFSKVLTLYLK